jgi:hypothetical protein
MAGVALVKPEVLTDAPSTRVAAVGLGLTVYLDEPVTWGRGGAAAMLRAYLDFLSPGRQRELAWYTVSTLEDWRPARGGTIDELLHELSNPRNARPRHQLWFRLVDNPGAPGFGFQYREVDSARMQRSGVLELMLPADDDPNILVQLALAIARGWPHHSGVGGYQASVNQAERPTAFWTVYRWCRRYWGLDVQDADAMAWYAVRALPGSNWLTMIGRKLGEGREIDLRALEQGWKRDRPDLALFTLPEGSVIRAGEAPTLGDCNRFEFPEAYAVVAAALERYFVSEPPELWGGFHAKKLTLPWLRRLVEPEGWR